MIVKERNWNNQIRNEFKKLLVNDLFDKIGIALSTRRRNGENISVELAEAMAQRVDDYFYTLVAADTPMSVMLPDRLKDAHKFYVFAIREVPTGAIILTFVALLGDDVEPAELQMIY